MNPQNFECFAAHASTGFMLYALVGLALLGAAGWLISPIYRKR